METRKFKDPILIAGWPGMGHVAITACYYLIAKLKMEFRAEYASSELFEADHVSIESGLVQPFRYPRNQVFAWRNPDGERDLLLFLGEAQPPHGRYNFCRKLVDFAIREGVDQIYTFAAMATDSQLFDESRVFGAATDKETRHEFLDNDVLLLKSGIISGMNGILLGVAAERKIGGGCLLGELPAMFANIPYPKAALAVLEAVQRIFKIEFALTEMTLESERMEAHLSTALQQLKRLEQGQTQQEATNEEETTFTPDPVDDGRLSEEEKALLEELFEKAEQDRSEAFELKRELDRLGVFREYEDRFLDLFKQDSDN